MSFAGIAASPVRVMKRAIEEERTDLGKARRTRALLRGARLAIARQGTHDEDRAERDQRRDRKRGALAEVVGENAANRRSAYRGHHDRADEESEALRPIGGCRIDEHVALRCHENQRVADRAERAPEQQVVAP